MPQNEKFSERLNYKSAVQKEITVREDAPHGLRTFIPMAFYELNKKPSELREIVCYRLRIAPNMDNWSEHPNIAWEVCDLLGNCPWYEVYDIIEKIIEKLYSEDNAKFTTEMNEYFIKNGIGWKIVNGLIETRGDKLFETSITKVVEVLEVARLSRAKSEIKEAIKDLSRRPDPDITGAIQHSVACLECVTREFTGDSQSTLGHLMKKFPNVIPKPLDDAVTKIWGFSSEYGRHISEGKVPEYLDAELVVEVSAAISTYLGKKLCGETPNNFDIDSII